MYPEPIILSHVSMLNNLAFQMGAAYLRNAC